MRIGAINTEHLTVYLMLGAYALVTLVISLYGFKREKNTPEDYFLASRTVGPVVLFFTIVATNFSAFFFLGFAGAGYRIGYSYYGTMAFGTAFVAVAFYLVGDRAWRIGQVKGYITPPELIGKSLNSKSLEMVYLAVMVIFTLPFGILWLFHRIVPLFPDAAPREDAAR